MYKVTNVVRRQNSRIRRAAAPGRRRFKQYVCGRRLLRKQKMLISEDEYRTYEQRLVEQVREGAIQIEAPDGTVLMVDVHGNLVQRKGMEVTPVGTAQRPPAPKPTPPTPPLASEPRPEAAPESKPAQDDLTELPNIGGGRAKKLEASGITSFKQVAEMAPGDLAKILGGTVTEDQAADICDAASEKEG